MGRVLIAKALVVSLAYISKKSLNFENSRVLQSAPEFSRVLKVQRFFADVLPNDSKWNHMKTPKHNGEKYKNNYMEW